MVTIIVTLFAIYIRSLDITNAGGYIKRETSSSPQMNTYLP